MSPVAETLAGGPERVTHREVLAASVVEDANLDVLALTAHSLRQSVSGATAGRNVLMRLYYLAYEEIVGDFFDEFPGPDFLDAA